MNRRLQQFLAAENISQSLFADTIGVARASVSHILAGRNKPGFDFIESMARHFPELNLDWLILGKGKMYVAAADEKHQIPDATEGSREVQNPLLFDDSPSEESENSTYKASKAESYSPQITMQQAVEAGNRKNAAKRGISKIMVFFDDGTYQELK